MRNQYATLITPWNVEARVSIADVCARCRWGGEMIAISKLLTTGFEVWSVVTATYQDISSSTDDELERCRRGGSNSVNSGCWSRTETESSRAVESACTIPRSEQRSDRGQVDVGRKQALAVSPIQRYECLPEVLSRRCLKWCTRRADRDDPKGERGR